MATVVWSYLVNLVNVSSIYWQATFARRCLSLFCANDQKVVRMLRLAWFQMCACFGVEVHSLNMSSVTSRVSNGVGLGVSLASDWSWRCRQTTVWARRVSGRRSSAPGRRSNHSGPSRGLRQFSSEPVGESQSLRMKQAEKYSGFLTADLHQKMSVKSGRGGHQREWSLAAALPSLHLQKPQQVYP